MSDPSLLTSYGGNLMATISIAVLAGAVWVCKNKCRHMRWKVNSGCCNITGDDIVTQHEKPKDIATLV